MKMTHAMKHIDKPNVICKPLMTKGRLLNTFNKIHCFIVDQMGEPCNNQTVE